MRSAQNLCFVVNRFYALFRLNGSSKPSLTSKPLLTIALKILKTIEKPLVPMVGPPKKHSMVMVQLCQNHWKTIDGNGGLKKTLTIPSPWKIDHRCGLRQGDRRGGWRPKQAQHTHGSVACSGSYKWHIHYPGTNLLSAARRFQPTCHYSHFRDRWRLQNGCIFGKVPNGLWPAPLPSFLENHNTFSLMSCSKIPL